MWRRPTVVAALTLWLLGVSSPSDAAPTVTFKATDRVVVVGGGPAGVHYASLLAKKGLQNVTLIEAADKVGGKSYTTFDDHGFPQEMGTVFALNSYTPIFDLVNQYDPTNERFEFALYQQNYMACMGESIGAKDDDPVTSIDFPHFLMRSIRMNAPPELRNGTEAQLRALFLDQATRYAALHRQLLGTYPYGMPPQPTNWTRIDMTAMQFLTTNNLTALVGMIRFFQQQQGYGILERIPAFYFLWWSYPDTVLDVMGASLRGTPCAYEFTKGFQSIWISIMAAHKQTIKTILGATVTRVTRGQPSASVTYSTKQGTVETIECDHVVMAVDLSVYARLVTDLTPDESALFVGSYTASTYVTTLYESMASPIETATQIWPQRMHQDARVSSLRNAKLSMPLLNPISGYQGGASRVDQSAGRQVRVAYQFYDKPLAAVDRAVTTSTMVADLTLAGMANPAVWNQKFFNYFPRFTAEGLKKGLPWTIWDRQFDHRTTWIGSSVCFESALDVVTYNNNLIKRVAVVA